MLEAVCHGALRFRTGCEPLTHHFHLLYTYCTLGPTGPHDPHVLHSQIHTYIFICMRSRQTVQSWPSSLAVIFPSALPQSTQSLAKRAFYFSSPSTRSYTTARSKELQLDPTWAFCCLYCTDETVCNYFLCVKQVSLRLTPHVSMRFCAQVKVK